MYCTITAHKNQFTYLHNFCPACCGPETTIKEENLHKDIQNPVWTIHNTILLHTGHFIMFSMITNIYNKKIKGPTLMELFTATGKLKKFFFDN